MLRRFQNIWLWGFLIFYVLAAAQNPRKADSLKQIYWSNEEEKDNIEILLRIANYEANPDSILKYSKFIIDLAKGKDKIQFLRNAYLIKGGGHRLKGEYDLALKADFKSLELANKMSDSSAIALSYIEIGNVYSMNGNAVNAELYYSKGIDILRRSKNQQSLGQALFNAGDEYVRLGELKLAEAYTLEAEELFKKQNFQMGRAYSLGNLGRIYAGYGKEQKAEEYLNEAMSILKDLEAYDAIAEFLISLAEVYNEKGDPKRALAYTNRSLDISREHGLKEYISNANLKLAELYEATGDTSKSYMAYREHILYRDSVRNIQSIREMANLRTDFVVSQKQVEVDLLNQEKKNQKVIAISSIVAMVLIMLLALGLYRRNRFIKRTNLIIEKEKNRSERLLRNILPEETARELKETGKVKAKKFESVSVLFTDFVGFTHYAENRSPENLVKSVDYYYSKFDEIVEKFGLEKIKTVGDSYMCAAGVPFPINDHAVKIVYAALEIVEFMEQSRNEEAINRINFSIRIGINSGPIIAGVVGSKKFAYDVWGDAVNIASRMESTSEAGKINISENTYQLVKHIFNCEYRGEIDVKNKGIMKMYFVTGVKQREELQRTLYKEKNFESV